MSNPTLVMFLVYLLFVLKAGAEVKSNVHIVYLGERTHDDPEIVTDSHHDMLTNLVGSKELASELMVYSYKHGFSGFAAKLTEAEAQKLAGLPGVVRVIPNRLHKLLTTRSWDYLGLSSDGQTNNLLHKTNMGDGAIIGVIDSGVWPESASFNDEGLGPIPSKWKGICQSGQEFNLTHCNRKIIGARWFVDGFYADFGHQSPGNREFLSPRDAGGHGTHTASTAGGSFVGNVSYKGLARGTLRGGAPRARLAIYKVCWNFEGGHCASADILKAIDEAINDGVDVISMSIGSPVPLSPDVDDHEPVGTGAFHAVAKGITVVCGAGNEGPAAQTIHNTAPWILTVAASTMDRAFPTPIILGNNETLQGRALYPGKEIGFAGLVYPESNGLDTNLPGDCEFLSFTRTPASGKVVLCFTTSDGRGPANKASAKVRAAGGIGVIVARSPGASLGPIAKDFPCIEVDYDIGTRILNYIRSTTLPTVKLNPSKTLVGNPGLAKIASFSNRGPSSMAPAILKPDIAAPGVNILAATSARDVHSDGGFAMYSGTSMATPHVSGIVALLKILHPDWSPAAMKSALTTTAWRHSSSGFPISADGSSVKLADPFDFGGGIVNPNGAADPGLIYDMGTTDYDHYLCAMGYNNSAISHLKGQPTVCSNNQASILDVNLPSITIPSLRNSTILKRTVTNVGPSKSIYRAVIEPPLGIMVSLKPNVLVFNSTVKTLSFSLTVSSTHQANTEFNFGSLTWTDGVHTVRSPLSVRTDNLLSLSF